MMKKVIALALFSCLHSFSLVGDGVPRLLEDADKLAIDVNKAEAYVAYTNLLVSPEVDIVRGQVLQKSLICLIDLNRTAETDALIESHWTAQTNFAARLSCIAAHAKLPRFGAMEKGAFRRGQVGGMDSSERDRVVEFRMLFELMPEASAQDEETRAKFWRYMASVLLSNGRNGFSSSRLLELTDIAVLPDYEEKGVPWYRPFEKRRGGWAPVNDAGEPIYHALPEAWESAKTDGERWRYAVEQLPTNESKEKRASFAERQFGLHRLHQEGPRDSLIAELRTLTDDETLTCLQDGIHRLKLPDDYNYLKIWRTLKDWFAVGDEYVCRYQFEKAVATYSNEVYSCKGRIRDLISPDVEIDASGACPIAGRDVTFGLKHRNAHKATFSLCRIDRDRILERVKQNVKDLKPHENWLDYEWSSERLMNYNSKNDFPPEFLMGTTNTWSIPLVPKPGYQESRETVKVPFDLESGDYLLIAETEEGKRRNTILRVGGLVAVQIASSTGESDKAKVTKFRVVDAKTGEPLAGVRAERFSWRQVWKAKTNDVFEATAVSDVDGILAFNEPEVVGNWFDGGFIKMTATNGLSCLIERPSLFWCNDNDGGRYSPNVFVMTDRPVYHPGDTVHFKIWHWKTTPDEEGGFMLLPVFNLDVKARTPGRDEAILPQRVVSDIAGGMSGFLKIPDTATLGEYRLTVSSAYGEGHFRVEEYRKPEFEVCIDTPTNSPILGDVVRVPVRARYYFGEPVRKGKARIRVVRQSRADDWVRPLPWYWLYGKGMPSPAKRETLFTRTMALDENGVAWVTIDTSLVKRFYGMDDAEYTIEAEVTDESRRMVSGSGSLLVRVKPFRVHVWSDGSRYQVGDIVRGRVDLEGLEKADVSRQMWRLVSLAGGTTNVVDSTFTVSAAGQYQLVCEVTDRRGRVETGSCIVTVLGAGDDGRNYRFNPLELATDRKFYAPGETAQIFISTDRPDSTVFVRIRRGGERILKVRGKCATVPVLVLEDDYPEFFVEAWTVAEGRFYHESITVKVPPVKKVGRAEVEILGGKDGAFAPGDIVDAIVRTYDSDGIPCAVSGVMSVYDKSLDAIAGGSNVPDLKRALWGWRPNVGSRVELKARSLGSIYNLGRSPIGFGLWSEKSYFGYRFLRYSPSDSIVYFTSNGQVRVEKFFPSYWDVAMRLGGFNHGVSMKRSGRAPSVGDAAMVMKARASADTISAEADSGVALRQDFADTAYWNAWLEDSGTQGVYRVQFKLPEDLTSWNVKVWTLGEGGRVAEAKTEIVTRKELVQRLQAPRFLTEGDEAVLSANVHNNGTTVRRVSVRLQLEGAAIANELSPQEILLEPGQERRVDWRIAAKQPGELKITMSASDADGAVSDGVVRTISVVPHVMEKTVSYSRVIGANARTNAPAVGVYEGADGLDLYRRLGYPIPAGVAEADLSAVVEVSDTLSDAIVRAIPYLRYYEYECTEQTMNRFVPAVVARKALGEQVIGLAQGDIDALIRGGLAKLEGMQLSSGAWGWFSGNFEQPSVHTTATVLRGLLIARQKDVDVPDSMIQSGIRWLGERIQKIVERWRTEKFARPFADDVFAAYVLQLAGADASAYAKEIETVLTAADEKRLNLPFYSQAQLGLAFDLRGEWERRDRIVRNLKQFLCSDDENQTCYFNLGNNNYWWFWYGSELEAQSTALMLLVRAEPQGIVTRGLARYIHNNRPNRNYWYSTRDTGLAIEALSAYCAAVENAAAERPLYVNAYLTYPSTEEPMTRAGLEVRVNRTVTRNGRELADGDEVKSGDLLDIRLDIDSKNDYEYIVIEDRKGAGLEPIGTRSGYQWFRDGGYAYVEYREKHVAIFLRVLSRGAKSLTYRVRAETPGRYHVLPTTIRAMYAPRLKGNSDELRLGVVDE